MMKTLDSCITPYTAARPDRTQMATAVSPDKAQTVQSTAARLDRAQMVQSTAARPDKAQIVQSAEREGAIVTFFA